MARLALLALLLTGACTPLPKQRCEIDGVEMPVVVYDAFRASLELDEKSRVNGGAAEERYSTVHARGRDGQTYVVDERVTKEGTLQSIRREPSANDKNTMPHDIDGKLVAAPVYDAFRASLTEVPHSSYSRRTKSGGRSGLSGTAKDRTHWTVTERDEGNDSRYEIEREEKR